MHKEFKKRLIELSDINLQKKLWRNIDNDTGLISSYTELICSLFDDFDFHEEIKTIENEYLRGKLHIVKNMLDNYKEHDLYTKTLNDNYILTDPSWKEIISNMKPIICKKV